MKQLNLTRKTGYVGKLKFFVISNMLMLPFIIMVFFVIAEFLHARDVFILSSDLIDDLGRYEI